MSTRALIQKGQIKEGVKVTIKEGATLPCRAAGGHWGANYAKNDFQATVVRAYVTDTGEIAKGGNPYLQSMVVVVTGNGVEVEVECGVCYYSGIDCDGFVVLAQDEVAELEASEDEVKEAKSDEACKLFNELDDDGLVNTIHYDEALCQKQNVQYHWDDDVSIGDIDTVIEYFKTLKQLIKLERKVSKLAIYG